MKNNANLSLLSSGVDIQGNVILDHGVSCFGIVKGSVISGQGLLHIGDTGHIVGNLDGEHIRVDGSVEGDVRARESIEINGRVHGNIFYSGTIRLGPNVVVDGQLKRISRDRVIDAPTEKVPPLSVVQRDVVSL